MRTWLAAILAVFNVGNGLWRPAYWPAAVTGAGFLAIHALIHLAMIATGHDQHAVEDVLAVIVPAALAVCSAFPTPEERQPGERQHASLFRPPRAPCDPQALRL
jgi:hypothetical protein